MAKKIIPPSGLLVRTPEVQRLIDLLMEGGRSEEYAVNFVLWIFERQRAKMAPSNVVVFPRAKRLSAEQTIAAQVRERGLKGEAARQFKKGARIGLHMEQEDFRASNPGTIVKFRPRLHS